MSVEKSLTPSARRVWLWRALFMTIVPAVGLLMAARLAWTQGVSWTAFALFFGFYLASAVGVEVGFHRYFSHRAFKCGPALRTVLGAFGSMAGQGPVLYWAATHRLHHRHTDTAQDPHAPLKGGLTGWWRSHMGWLFSAEPLDVARIAPDLVRDPTTVRIQAHYLGYFTLGLAAPAALGFVAGGALGAYEGFLWGGLVRIFANHHVTWSVNSLCHLVGARPFATNDNSRNLWILALPTMGGAWHNNHHAFPASACNDFKPWQIDPGAWLIKAAERLGLVWDVRRPPPAFLNGAD